jgi:predicted porin
MTKIFLALAAASAFASPAKAQSNVTVFGSVDGGLRYHTHANAAGDDRLTIGSNGTSYNNRLGFRGSESLGGGYAARFHLEAGFNLGTGTLDNTSGQLFQRTITVGLASPWGAIDVGRQFSVAFKVAAPLSPFGSYYTGVTPLAIAVPGSQTLGTPTASTAAANAGVGRFNNDVQYTGTFGSWTARAEYAAGEQSASLRNGSAHALGLSYANGPLLVGAVYTRHKPNMGTTTAPSWQDRDHWLAGAAYTIGAVRASMAYVDDKVATDAAGERHTRWTWGGLEYRLSPVATVTGAYYHTRVSGGGAASGKRGMFMVGATYALSKRTNYYAEFDASRHRGTLLLNTQDSTKAFSAGLNHLF